MNPWITGWTRPAVTIRNVLTTNPKRGFWPLICATSVTTACFVSYFYSMGWRVSFFLAVLAGSLLSTYLMAWCLKTTGRLLRGEGSTAEFLPAVLWSSLPNFLSLLVWSTIIFLNPNSAFILNATHTLAISLWFIGLALSSWQLYLLTGMVREIQGFSFFKAIFNIVLSYSLLFILFLIVLFPMFSVYFLVF